MKNQTVQFIVATIQLLFFSLENFAQAPDLGIATNYVLFTKTGAVGNTGVSQVRGSIGTNDGAITGFEAPTSLTGNIDSGNTFTEQSYAAVQAAYDQLFNTAATNTSHTPSFGLGETLFADVYEIAAAGSIAGDLTLDAQGDPNAVFIFKFGGAFTTGASSTIFLINGASACNVFWAANGAIAMAAITTMKGTLIANNGAISMGAGGSLEGRMLSTTGAASIYAVSATVPCSVLPVKMISFTGTCDMQNVVLNWATATETENDYFTLERSIDGINWKAIGTVPGTGNSSSQQSYSYTDIQPKKEAFLYRVKQTDFNGRYKYGMVIAVAKCGTDAVDKPAIYPNPSNGQFELLIPGKNDKARSIDIFNAQGRRVYTATGLQSKFDLSDNAPGIYFMFVTMDSKTKNLKIVVEK